MSTYSSFAESMLIALYQETERTDEQSYTFGELIDRYGLDVKESWISRLANEWENHFTGEISRFLEGSARDWHVEISGSGMRYIEEKYGAKDGVGLILAPAVALSAATMSPNEAAAPASDRLVSFNHNEATYVQIACGLADLKEAVRASNGLEEVERDRLSRSVSAAEELWRSVQLRVIQVKVGVLLTVEDVATALAGTAKAVAAALLVDTIKAFIKTQAGVDLDHI